MAVPLQCANCGEGHASTSIACPKKVAAIQKSKVAQEVVRARTPSVPAKNAWANKLVPTMEDFPQTLAAAAPPQLKHTVEVSKPQAPLLKTVTNKGVIAASTPKRLPASVQTDSGARQPRSLNNRRK